MMMIIIIIIIIIMVRTRIVIVTLIIDYIFFDKFSFLLNKKRLRERERFEKKQTVSSTKSSSKVLSIDNTEIETESPKEPSVAESWRSMSLDALGTYMSLDFIISSEIIDA